MHGEVSAQSCEICAHYGRGGQEHNASIPLGEDLFEQRYKVLEIVVQMELVEYEQPAGCKVLLQPFRTFVTTFGDEMQHIGCGYERPLFAEPFLIVEQLLEQFTTVCL